MFFSQVGAVMSQRLSDSCLLSSKDDEKKAAMQIASFARHGTAHHTALLHTKNEQVLFYLFEKRKRRGKSGITVRALVTSRASLFGSITCLGFERLDALIGLFALQVPLT